MPGDPKKLGKELNTAIEKYSKEMKELADIEKKVSIAQGKLKGSDPSKIGEASATIAKLMPKLAPQMKKVEDARKKMETASEKLEKAT